MANVLSDDGVVVDMAMDLELSLNMSWKDKLLGVGLIASGKEHMVYGNGSDGGLVLLEGDVIRSIINGILEIDFSIRIKLPGLPGFIYKRRILKAIGGMVLVNGEIQHVEYEALLTICFSCGKYEQVKYICPSLAMDPVSESGKKATFELSREAVIGTGVVAETMYGMSMMVERKSRRGKSDSQGSKDKVTKKATLESRFTVLFSRGLNANFEAQAGSVNLTGVRVDGEARLGSVGDVHAGSYSSFLTSGVVDRAANLHKGDLGFGAITHFNPIFEDFSSMNVTLDGAVLDPGKRPGNSGPKNKCGKGGPVRIG
ncbi:hypothetical protein GOBAR_DD18205 [Gossypium barbadense]|nr:hypothetical protein GOBAR_DD18205 [Gossypium barbadense]